MASEKDDTKARSDGGRPAAALDPRILRALKLGLPAATAVMAMIVGALLGPAPAILVLAAGALVGVIAVFWASIRTLAGETPLAGADAYALGAPRVEEEKKRAVLRALKDLEFERAVGKISEEDYRVLVAKYRAEAKRLLRLLDEEAAPRRKQAEQLVAARLRKAGLLEGSNRDGTAEEAAEPTPAPKRAKGKKRAAPLIEQVAAPAQANEGAAVEAASPSGDDVPRAFVCPDCGTNNDADAVFCKKCGTRRAKMEEAPRTETETEGAAT